MFHSNADQLSIRRSATIVLMLSILSCLCLPAFAAEDKVNINTASATELALLPRVGPAVSQRIVDFREDNGPFKSLEELMLVRGIGEKTFEQMLPYITLKGDTTLSEKVRTQRAREGADS
ncbi:MAG: helix-hairpin-helix domain-containing protein [Acidobacteriota bacterium]